MKNLFRIFRKKESKITIETPKIIYRNREAIMNLACCELTGITPKTPFDIIEKNGNYLLRIGFMGNKIIHQNGRRIIRGGASRIKSIMISSKRDMKNVVVFSVLPTENRLVFILKYMNHE